MSPAEPKRKRLPAVLSIVLCVLFLPIIVVNLAIIFSTYANPGEMPGAFGIKPAIVLSGSMEPEIRVGDLIFLHRVDPGQLQVGDVICYLTSGKAVTHRIAEITRGEDGQIRYMTRGDANNAPDRLAVSPEQIQGIWLGGRVGGLGSAIMFLQTPTGMVLFLVCPLLLLLAWDLWRRRRLDRAKAARTAELEAELAALRAGQAQSDDPGEPR